MLQYYARARGRPAGGPARRVGRFVLRMRNSEVKSSQLRMETCVEEKRVGFEVSKGLIIRERDLRDCIGRLKHSGSDESALVVTEREHGECTNNVPCTTVCVDGPRDARLVIRLSWEADSAW